MKRFCITFGLLCIIIVVVLLGRAEKPVSTPQSAYLRMHVRANSNLSEDQAVKYRVRDAVVEYLTPLVADCDSKRQTDEVLRQNLRAISGVAARVLRSQGFYYGATARLAEEEFPTRVYEGLTLAQGVYDALIIELGSGKGDNWWCVIYPPLCFTGETDGTNVIRYRSKIIEIINRFKRKQTGGNT